MNANGERGGVKREAERAQWVQRYRGSGLGLKRFAAHYVLPAGQWHYRTYSPRGLKAVARATGFHEVTAAIPWKSATSWAAEIGLPDGTTVRLDGRAEVAWVKQVVKSLRLSCVSGKRAATPRDAARLPLTMGNAGYPFELFLRVITVSLETMKIVNSLPPLGEREA